MRLPTRENQVGESGNTVLKLLFDRLLRPLFRGAVNNSTLMAEYVSYQESFDKEATST